MVIICASNFLANSIEPFFAICRGPFGPSFVIQIISLLFFLQIDSIIGLSLFIYNLEQRKHIHFNKLITTFIK